MNEDKIFIEGHVVGLFADSLGNKGKQIKFASGDIVDIDDDFIYKSIGPETGHADEAPRYLKNILARLRELPLHDREVWLKAIMGEFEQDFSHAKWREGYEQGKFEGEWVGNQLKDADKVRRELNKPVIPQFVADWYEENKDAFEANLYRCAYNIPSVFDSAKLNEFERWFLTAGTKPFQTLVNMHQFGYEVEEEKRYIVKIKNLDSDVRVLKKRNRWCFGGDWDDARDAELKIHTRKQLEEANFGWVFDCEGIEIEEVEG